MAVKCSREALILLKIRLQGFLRSLIKVLLLELQNSKWRNQDDAGTKFEESLDCAQKWYTVVFDVADHDFADYDFAMRPSKFKMCGGGVGRVKGGGNSGGRWRGWWINFL